MGWIARLFGRKRLDRDLDREMRFHLAEETARLIREGVTAAEAQRRARAAFGGLETMKEYTRDARGTAWLHDLSRDIRYAFRLMRRNPGFTIAAVLSLAIGIGANAAIFGVTDALILRHLPVQRPAELSFLNHAGFDEENRRYSYPGLLALRQAAPEAELSAMSGNARMQIMLDGSAELVLGQLVSGNWFELLGVKPARGRLLSTADSATLDAAPVVVLSHGFWTRRFAANPSVLGSTLTVNGLPLTIVGVAAPGFRGITVGESTDLWMPVTMQHPVRYAGNASTYDADSSKPWVPQDGIHWLTLTLRIPDGVDRQQLFAKLAAAHRRLVEARANTLTDPENRAFALRDHLELLPGYRGLSELRRSFSMPLTILTLTAAIVLLIGCANLASLLLARGSARGREFALRVSLGANRIRIVRQLLVESAALSLAGGAVGLVFARWGTSMLLRIASPSGRAIPIDVPFDWRFVGFTVGVSLLTGLAFGLMPALRLSRGDLAGSMKSAGRIAGRDQAGRLPFSKALVVIQVALTLVLVVGAVLFLQTFRNLLHADSGLALSQIVMARFDPRLAQIPADRLPVMNARLLEEAGRVPGAQRAALAVMGAVSGSMNIGGFIAEGQPRLPAGRSSARGDYVSSGYFDVMGMRLVAGRDFDAGDVPSRGIVVVVNQAFARKFFGTVDPLGHRIGYSEPANMTIVGIVQDARIDGVREPVPPMVYQPLSQNLDLGARFVYVRVSGASESAKPALSRAVTTAEPGLAIRDLATLDDMAERTLSNERVISQLTGAFGLIAVFVACLGLYGTVSYSVARRTNEIGVRLALGAAPSRVRGLVLLETLSLVFVGSVLGLGLVAGLMRYASKLLYGLSPYDPMTLALSTTGLLGFGLLAGLLPAWRASRVDPLKAIRAE